jgi:tripartite ATP-independent transporter DctM subunit
MDPIAQLGIVLAVIIGLMALGMRVFYAILAVSIGCLGLMLDPPQYRAMGSVMWESSNSFILTALPLFVLMAEILTRGGIARSAFDAIAHLLRFLPGGAAYANIVGSAVFAAISGSSVANAAALGTVAAPQMIRLGFGKKLTFGSIAAGGTLGILMPPSSAMIIYGSITGVSIGQLFIAGIVPALLVSLLFVVIILGWSLIRPQDIPAVASTKSDERSLGQHLAALLPVLGLIVFVLGGLYVGMFSPTEAAAAGVLGSVVLCIAFRQLRWRDLWLSALATVMLTSMIVMVIGAASVLKYVLAYLQLPAQVTALVTEQSLTLGAVMLMVTLLYFVLGIFVESVTLIVLTVPVLFPVLTSLGIDGVWLGVYLVLMIEVSLLTPPVGLNLFVLQRIPAGQSFGDIAIGALPFVTALLAATLLLYLFPGIATGLPELARASR